MKFSPGESISYSHGSYVFLGVLIEKRIGINLKEFISNMTEGDEGVIGFIKIDCKEILQ